MSKRTLLIAALAATFGFIGGCQPRASLEDQTQALSLTADSMAVRQMQSRRFETEKEKTLLSAGAGVLQDLGFILDETSGKTGLLTASKERGTGSVYAKQRVRVSLVTRKINDDEVVVRVTFQEMILNGLNNLIGIETIKDPEIYQLFFNTLSQSVFLEAHSI